MNRADSHIQAGSDHPSKTLNTNAAAYILMPLVSSVSTAKETARSLEWPRYSATSENRVPSAPEPRNEREKALATIWCEILKLPKVGSESNFFDIGGGTRCWRFVLSQRIRDQFHVDLSLRTFFANATIAALAKIIDQEIGQAAGAAAAIQKIPRRQRHGPETRFLLRRSACGFSTSSLPTARSTTLSTSSSSRTFPIPR